jgi:hypothetical protein
MAYDYYLEATYDDGYVHSEKELHDASPYVEGSNTHTTSSKDYPTPTTASWSGSR